MYTVLKQLMKDKMYRGLDTQNKNVTVFCATKVKQSSYHLKLQVITMEHRVYISSNTHYNILW